MFTTTQLLQAISPSKPCGEDMMFSSEFDAIVRARLADDPTIEQGAWASPLKEADWSFVANQCARLIAACSKDLRLAVWLAEASAKTAQLRGLGESLLLIAGLCDRYWSEIHPQADEAGFEQRIGNLCWLAARLPQLLREMSLTEGGGTQFSSIDVERARQRHPGQAELQSALETARHNSSRAFHQALLTDSAYCMAAIGELERVIDERLGVDGPGFGAARQALQAFMHEVTPAAQQAGVSPGAMPAEASLAPAGAPALLAVLGASIHTRGDALAQLRLVAEFFRRTEPHSPVAYLADKAAHWGEQPLHVWLRGVVKDPASYAHLEELLGLQSSAGQS